LPPQAERGVIKRVALASPVLLSCWKVHWRSQWHT
jgi:hypothetical protein